MIKKETIFGLAGIIIVGVFLLKIINDYQKNNSLLLKNTVKKNNQNTNKNNQNIPKDNIITLTLEEISKHNSANDCWLVINNNVYNVTSYLNQHPGGAKKIKKFCGKDASKAFATKGKKNKPHSPMAQNQLKQLFIGSLNQKINTSFIK